MDGRRAIVGLCLLCALAFSAFAAESASAVTKGTTVFTCKKGTPAKGFSDEHCTKEAVSPEAKFEHVSVAENTTTTTSYTSAKTNAATTEGTIATLGVTIGGAELELSAKLTTGEGSLTNKKDPTTGEHYVEGTGLIVYHEVEVTKPKEKGCTVTTDNEDKSKGAVGTVDAHVNATSKGQGDFLKFEPATGTAFATFWIECTDPTVPAVLKGTWEITGSLKCPVKGATIECSETEVTAQNTLKAKGNKAGYGGKLTVSGKDIPAGDKEFTPLSVTTVET
jgi:hypothetical protein